MHTIREDIPCLACPVLKMNYKLGIEPGRSDVAIKELSDYQTPPTKWGINTDLKRGLYNWVKVITGLQTIQIFQVMSFLVSSPSLCQILLNVSLDKPQNKGKIITD